MSDLERQARAIVEAGRDADAPSAADHDRIKRAVLFQIAAGGAVLSTAAATTLSVGTKVGLVVLAATIVGGGAVGLHHMRGAKPPAAAHQHVVRKATTPALAPVAAPAVEVEESPAPPASEDRARKPERLRRPILSPTRVAPASDQDRLSEEVAVLRRAREELRMGRPRTALATLDEYDRRFGAGALAEERQAIAAIAACLATPGAAAKAQAEAFMRRAPRSPLRDRVREACITPAAQKSP
jgi:signal transduction histidine kinase